MSNEKFYWNGEPCKRVRFLDARVLPTKGEDGKLPWWKPLEGSEVQVIEVQPSYGPAFLIDNTDGLGYCKLVKGGMYTQGSRHFDGVDLYFFGETEDNRINREFSKEAYDLIEQKNDAYWREHNPERWSHLQALKTLAIAHNKYNAKA
jgi:hypothetical protein